MLRAGTIPANLDELHGLLEHAVLQATTGEILPADLPPWAAPGKAALASLEEMERAHIAAVI